MEIKPFETEKYFEKYEFTSPYMLSASDCETVRIADLIEMGGGSADELLNLRLGYTPLGGSVPLRQQISGLYESVAPDQIIVLGTPVEGIFLTCQVLLGKNDHVIALTPAYDSLMHSAQFACDNFSNWNLKLKNNKWSLDIEELEKLIQPNTRLLMLNFPHNPTGYLPTHVEFREIFEIASKRDIWVFSDEMYRGLEYSAADTLPSAADLYEKAITLCGVSKSLGLPGLRFGWLTIKNKILREKLSNWKNYTSMCSPQTTEYLGAMAIRSRDQLIEKNVGIIKNNLNTAKSFFADFTENFNWIPPMAGSVSVVELKKEPAEQYCHRVAGGCGAVLLPSRYMGAEDRFFRMGFGRKNFQKNIGEFKKYLLKKAP